MDLSKKRNFNGGGDWESHIGHWERSGKNGIRDSKGKNNGNVAGLGGGRGNHVDGRQDGNKSGGKDARVVMVTTTTPSPPARTGGECRVVVRTIGKEVCWPREKGLIGAMGKRNKISLRKCH